jgi:glycosyltransferase involved in cell wall biosynthesis
MGQHRVIVDEYFKKLRGSAKLGNLRQHPPETITLSQHGLVDNRPLPPTKVTLTTPTLNQRQFIEFTLESVISQGYPYLEYVVQDGGSTDGTQKLLDEYQAARELTYRSSQDSGIAQAINRGFEGTRGEIMAYVNSDDLLLPGSLLTVVKWFASYPDIDVVYGHRILVDNHGYQTGRWILPPHHTRVMYWEDYVPQETLFWRRRIWDRVGGAVDESFQFAVDWDLILRFAQAGARFTRIPRFLGGFRVHESQKTSSQMTSVGIREVSRLLQRYHGYVPERREIERQVAIYVAEHHLYDFAYQHGALRH